MTDVCRSINVLCHFIKEKGMVALGMVADTGPYQLAVLSWQ